MLPRQEAAISRRRRVVHLYIQTYIMNVRFIWDAAKSEANLRDRGFDFGFASLVFAGLTLEREDTRRDYGERRVISARRANRKERNVYETTAPAQSS